MYDPRKKALEKIGASYLEGTPQVPPELGRHTIEQATRDLNLNRFPIHLPHEAFILDGEAYKAVWGTVDAIKNSKRHPINIESFIWGAAVAYALVHKVYEPYLQRAQGLEKTVRSLRRRLRETKHPSPLIPSSPRKPLTPITSAELFLAQYMSEFQEENPNYSL